MTPLELRNAAQMRQDRRRHWMERLILIGTIMTLSVLIGIVGHIAAETLSALNRTW